MRKMGYTRNAVAMVDGMTSRCGAVSNYEVEILSKLLHPGYEFGPI